MNLLFMLLFACGDKTETVVTDDNGAKATATTLETTENVKVSTEASTNQVEQTTTNAPASDEVTEKTTDQTVTNQEQNTTEE